MTDFPRDLQAEDLYRLLWFMWPEGIAAEELADRHPPLGSPIDYLLARRRVEYMPDRRSYRARMVI